MKFRILQRGSGPAIYLFSEGDTAMLEAHAAATDCSLILAEDYRWNDDLTPWQAEAPFGKRLLFRGEADRFIVSLEKEIRTLEERERLSGNRIFAGVSLAALFGLYVSTKSQFFTAVVSSSPSLWYPHFLDYSRSSAFFAEKYVLLLGNKEKESRNASLSAIEEECRRFVSVLRDKGKDISFLLVEGNHFANTEKRLIQGLSLLER